MNESNQLTYHGARFYKCALQVNPFAYAKEQGKVPKAQTESQYNEAMLSACKSEKVKIVALANHGNVYESESLRKFLSSNNIAVFPGFEIASAEKIHMVCLFPADKPADELHGYLNAVSGDNAPIIQKTPTHPSALTFENIVRAVEKAGGVCYAPHVDKKDGILYEKRHDIWKNNLVRAVALTQDVTDVAPGIRRILDGKDDNYRRERPFAIIHANDVIDPEYLSRDRTSCWVKTTWPPTIESLRQAFFDPGSRISLNEPKSSGASHIRSIQWSGGGRFRENEVALSENLNAIIGGRGTGKSSWLESIRYALMLAPIGDNAAKSSDGIVTHNLKDSKVTVKVWSREQKNCFRISRRYGEESRVETDGGQPSNMSVRDILPRIDILGQNEILEISNNPQKVRELLETFLFDGTSFIDDTRRLREELRSNREQMLKLERVLNDVRETTSREASLKEQMNRLQMGGIEGKLANLSRVSEERRFCEKLDAVVDVHLAEWLGEWDSVADSLPSPPDNWGKWPNGDALAGAHRLFSDAFQKIATGKDTMRRDAEVLKSEFSRIRELVSNNWGKLQDEINHLAGQLPAQDGGPGGGGVIASYNNLRAKIDAVDRAKDVELKAEHAFQQTRERRQKLLEEYRELHFKRWDAMQQRAAEKLSESGLENTLLIKIERMGDREKLKSFIIAKTKGIGAAGMQWLDNTQKLDTAKMAERIRDNDPAGLRGIFSDFPPTTGAADKMIKMSNDDAYELEEVEVEDNVVVSLNLAAQGTPAKFHPIGQLSPGQQCTAILSLFLINRDAPLVLDQPEDHLDNAFIAGHIAENIRHIKKNCQLILSTHNASIPVFGDAELMAVLETDEHGRTVINNELLGSIDKPAVKEKAADILDGGQEAFTIRREKYGY